jgi:hypothetical protein
VVEHREREFGSQNVDTLRSINFLAEAMTAHSKNNEVTNLYRTVMEKYSVYDGTRVKKHSRARIISHSCLLHRAIWKKQELWVAG